MPSAESAALTQRYGTDRPQGTPSELKELNMDPARFGSCAAQGPNSIGCPLYEEGCPAVKARDAGVGPVMIGVNVILSPGEGALGDGKILPCWNWLWSGLKDRQKNAVKSKEIVKVMGVQGDDVVIETKTSKRTHETRAEGLKVNCDGCAKGECMLRETVWEPINLKDVRFPRPREVYKGMAQAAAMRAGMLSDIAKEQEREMMLPPQPKGYRGRKNAEAQE